MNKWTRRVELSRASAGPAAGATAPFGHHYFAFLSYSHADSAEADWLHHELERFRVPSALAGRLTANGVIPKRLSPIFRDRHELAASDDLTEEIRFALTASRCLIVLCSPAAAKSKWTNEEIEYFKRVHPDGCVIAAIIAGEPGRDCFPEALTQRYDRRGRPTGRHAEPLAADLRAVGDGKRLGLLKIIAGILGVGLDDLVQRDHLRRQRRLAMIAVASVIGMLIAIGLAVIAIRARDAARDQRREAESLIEFMVGDLKDKLAPIGRLDVLDGVGSRVLDYYSKQDTSELSDQGLGQRSKALQLMGQVAQQRGNLSAAARLYREAAAGTAESVRRDPSDPQRIFEHAQNVFYVADVARQTGDLGTAESLYRRYQSLAHRMVALDPNNLKWRMEVEYADVDLATAFAAQRRFAEARAQYEQALSTIEAVVALDGSDPDYQKGLSEALAWLADAQLAEGQLDSATATRERQIRMLNALQQRSPDVDFQRARIVAQGALGRLYAMRGNVGGGVAVLRAAVDDSNRLSAVEPANTKWAEYGFKARLELAQVLIAVRNWPEAEEHLKAGCNTVASLLRKDSAEPDWKAGLRDCHKLRSRIALATGSNSDALDEARKAVAVGGSVKTTDQAKDRLFLAKAYLALGDSLRLSGDRPGAASAWNAGLALLPASGSETPSEMATHATILGRLGRAGEAAELSRKLFNIGDREQGI